MGFIIAAAIGGFFVGGLIFGFAGFTLGYIQANQHNLAAGTVLLQNIATVQAKQQPQVQTPKSTERNHVC
jgi:hypothetical protein